MPEFYSHAVVQKDDSSQGDNLDLAKALALQTLEMQGAWQHQQAASQICGSTHLSLPFNSCLHQHLTQQAAICQNVCNAHAMAIHQSIITKVAQGLSALMLTQLSQEGLVMNLCM